MKATLDRIVILTAAAGFLVLAHFFRDQAVQLVGLAGLLTGLQIPYGPGPNPSPKGG